MTFEQKVSAEYNRAAEKYGHTFCSDNEAIGTFTIEMHELYEAYHKRDYANVAEELVQIAAMALKAHNSLEKKQRPRLTMKPQSGGAPMSTKRKKK